MAWAVQAGARDLATLQGLIQGECCPQPRPLCPEPGFTVAPRSLPGPLPVMSVPSSFLSGRKKLSSTLSVLSAGPIYTRD